MTPTCSTCKHWIADGKQGNSIGECRRYAPRPRLLPVNDDSDDKYLTESGNFVSDALWPFMSASDWCGEWAGKFEMPVCQVELTPGVPAQHSDTSGVAMGLLAGCALAAVVFYFTLACIVADWTPW